MAQYADVLLPLPLPTTYTYSIPVECRHNAAVGCRVVVPLGKSKKYTALIMSLHDNCPQGYEVRPISELLDESPILLPRQMELWRWIAKYYLCTEGEIYKAAIPQFEAMYSKGLVDLDMYLAHASTESAADNLLSIIEGFAPVENDAQLCKEFDSLGILYIKEEAIEEDNPPIKLKNNRFVKMFEPLTGMYGMPGYTEYDPTPVVSIFFLLFFAMCMGDAGYGLVLMLVGLALNKGWVKIGMFDGLGSLIATLGTATTVIGAALGTFFGMSIVNLLPDSMTGAKAYYDFVGGRIATPLGELPFQMLLALGIGVFHLCLAMVIKAVSYTQRFGIKENIATWGWLLLIVGGVVLALLGVGKVLSPEAMKWAVIAVGGISALAIYIFNTPGRNPLINIGAGLWDTYNMATGILGDVLSYLRLFALGLAGGMLGQAFNNLAGSVRGDSDSIILWVPFIAILIVGHLMNLLLSGLGAFVHPMRLTFMEYFKNAGYEGKGSAYNPLTTNKEQ